MNHLIATFPFIVYATAVLILLTKSDTRRATFYRKIVPDYREFRIRKPIRMALMYSLLVPFMVFIVVGNAAGFLCYFGAITVIGWLVAEMPGNVI
ncbi:hypothetical protein PALB_35730 [Pseudoalteromonas luteoviolacea B = ATCC 29581]|nr:hypothetical protein PALB_35730 [Pseudoalteromonas luteoviolacea B = ATCC 29581]